MGNPMLKTERNTGLWRGPTGHMLGPLEPGKLRGPWGPRAGWQRPWTGAVPGPGLAGGRGIHHRTADQETGETTRKAGRRPGRCAPAGWAVEAVEASSPAWAAATSRQSIAAECMAWGRAATEIDEKMMRLSTTPMVKQNGFKSNRG